VSDVEQRFVDAWEGTFQDVVALQLLRRGKEITILAPLVATPRAANLVLDRMVGSADPLVRESAASLAGLLSESAPLDVLDRLLSRETETAAEDPMTALVRQENVRAIVFAAARFCRSDRARDAGLATCRTVVERTIDGGAIEHWTSSPYAMATLMRHAPDAPDARALLDRYAAWANGEPPAYVVPVSLQGERSCARALLANNENALRRVDAMIDERDAAGNVDVPERMRPAFDELLALAAQIG
jgi:hypothetical protein